MSKYTLVVSNFEDLEADANAALNFVSKLISNEAVKHFALVRKAKGFRLIEYKRSLCVGKHEGG
ncbi:hypothetical protein BDS110ZK4_70110 [Bradyrhizobium diazoefficiens]|uniref:Uncharacterized protein n=1 Tax=Bradyrhizobium diazoefficiens TaxID=1355477 RepID=A0A810CL38_9BRAD|nr:hypothetical protein XF1B_13780 [Bradyrhizobium diazoefficiens]BCE44949.1 hypothetical protein XF4B_12980 [Bradyrhizobium diazoefficiens]BCE88493.1 hypothetical protein XF10B_12910 [Bradyrhizobium diazoefficiens]BCF23425.1 hypothetical protein XF14B_13770 [Bradyrhizobium diazoefficiens]BCF40807.1 hypothetical protein XF16B_12970 [Bradyrhizobium diazoefficiens]